MTGRVFITRPNGTDTSYMLHLNDQIKPSQRGARTNTPTQITTVGFNTDFYYYYNNIDLYFFNNYANMITNTHEPNDAIPKHFCNIRR